MAQSALTDLQGSTWTNWVGNQSFTPAFAAAPRDVEEVVSLVRQAAERGVCVRVAGAGHSFTPVVETDGLLLDLSALRGVLDADAERKRATALAGTRIHDFYEPLWEAGLALRNQGDIDTQQIAGAVATATHGSGTRYTSLSGVVRGVQLVSATGEVRTSATTSPISCAPPRSPSGCSASSRGSSSTLPTPTACASRSACGRGTT